MGSVEKVTARRRKPGYGPEELPKTLKRATSPGGVMLKNIILERPLAVLDLETTGTDTKIDRIVEVSVLKLSPGGQLDHRTRRVNPGVPIPPEATAVHGITDDDVADCPAFRAIAPGLARFLDGCDLAASTSSSTTCGSWPPSTTGPGSPSRSPGGRSSTPATSSTSGSGVT